MVPLNTHFLSLSCLFLSDCATLKYCSKCLLVCAFLKWCGDTLMITLLYEINGVKALIEIRKVKEANFWSISDQSLCLWGYSRYQDRILNGSVGYYGIASPEAVLQLHVRLLGMDVWVFFCCFFWVLVGWIFCSFVALGVVFFCASVVRLFPKKICIFWLASEEHTWLPLGSLVFCKFCKCWTKSCFHISKYPQEIDLCFIKNICITYKVNVFLVFCLFFKRVMSLTDFHWEEKLMCQKFWDTGTLGFLWFACCVLFCFICSFPVCLYICPILGLWRKD